MINNKKIAVIMPAYNAEKTLEQTYNELYKDIVDEIILVDDNSSDKTKEVAKKLHISRSYVSRIEKKALMLLKSKIKT